MIPLPSEYRRYIEAGGVMEGITRGEPGYVALWRLDEVEQANKDLQVQEFAPGYIGFGGDGGGEMLAFDKDGIVYKLPMIGMEPRYARRIAANWGELQDRIETSGR